jgi:DNA-binding transcriptional regulator PaaX
VAYDVVEELGGLERRLTEYPAKLSDEQRTEIAIFHPNWSADTMRDVRLELERCELKEFHEHEHNYQAFIDSLKKLKHNNEGRWSDEIISSREALVKELIERHELRELDSIDFTAPEWTELEL